MLKFILHQDRIILDINITLLEEFKVIIEYGKKKADEELSHRMLLYVYWCCDLSNDNPMRDIDYRLKPEQALSRALARSKKKVFSATEIKLIEAAMDAYNFFNESALERVALAYDKKIDDLRTAFEEMEFEVSRVIDEVGQTIRIVSNEKIIDNLGKQIVAMADYKIKALDAAKKIENKGRVRGDKGSSLIERGVFLRDNKTHE